MDAFVHYPWLFIAFSAIFGLIIGSFLNVVIHRLPLIMGQRWQEEINDSFPKANIGQPDTKISLSKPSSRCPHCQTPIYWRDNIPVLSWCLLRAKGRCCQQKISIRYPLIELLTASTTGYIALHFGFSAYTLSLFFFSFALISLTFIDLDTMLLPDEITLGLLWGGIALAYIGILPISLEESVMGAMAGYLSLWSVYYLFKLATGKEGMGHGDFKLLAALGAWLGWQFLPMIVLLSSLVGLIIGLIYLKKNQQQLSQAIPFGPYLAIAGWIAALWGSDIMHWYLSHTTGVF